MKHHTNFAIAIILCAMMTGCENKTTGDTSQTDTSATASQTSQASDETEAATAPTEPSATIASEVSEPAPDAAPTVNPNGFGGLTFGQPINDELLNELGLVKDEMIMDEGCYYVSNPKLTYVDAEGDRIPAMYYQIINGNMALIGIRDASVPFYTGVDIGDSPAQVMDAHDGNVSYQVDKYATDGDTYELIYNVNFDANSNKGNPPAMGQVLKKENYQLNDNAKKYNQTTPLQVKYQFKGGQSLGQTDIAANAWTDEQKGKLTGTLYNIDIGEPRAIYLVEGCS